MRSMQIKTMNRNLKLLIIGLAFDAFGCWSTSAMAGDCKPCSVQAQLTLAKNAGQNADNEGVKGLVSCTYPNSNTTDQGGRFL